MSETKDKKDDISALLSQIRKCRICADLMPHPPRPVIRASASARLCVAGQAPGNRVQASGIPFDDPSGDRLRDWMGIGPEEFYDENRLALIPMGFCFPGHDAKGGDLPPLKQCAAHWREQLMDALPQIEMFILVGSYAQAWHLGKSRKKTLTETVRNFEEYLPQFLTIPHPSWRNTVWLKKNPWFETDVLPVLRKAVKKLI